MKKIKILLTTLVLTSELFTLGGTETTTNPKLYKIDPLEFVENGSTVNVTVESDKNNYASDNIENFCH